MDVVELLLVLDLERLSVTLFVKLLKSNAITTEADNSRDARIFVFFIYFPNDFFGVKK